MPPVDRAIAIAPFAAVVFVTIALGASTGDPLPQQPSKPPVPQAQADASSRTPLGMVVNWTRTIRASHPQPDAIIWDQVMASRDGTTVCLAYHLRSGDGERVQRQAFVSTSTGFTMMPWDTACSQGVMAVADAHKWISLP